MLPTRADAWPLALAASTAWAPNAARRWGKQGARGVVTEARGKTPALGGEIPANAPLPCSACEYETLWGHLPTVSMLQENWKDGIRSSGGARAGCEWLKPECSREFSWEEAVGSTGVPGVVPVLLGLEAGPPAWPWEGAATMSSEHQAS